MEGISKKSTSQIIKMFKEANSLRIPVEHKILIYRKVLEGLIKSLNGFEIDYSLDRRAGENINNLIKSLKYNRSIITLKVQTGIETLWGYLSEFSHLTQRDLDLIEFESKIERLKEILELTLNTEIEMGTSFNPREHLTEDLKFIKRMDKKSPLLNKTEFYMLLDFWYENNKFSGFSRINEALPTNNTPCVWVKNQGELFRLNGDSTITGVKVFLENRDNEWDVIENAFGRRNKVVVTKDKNPIPGFYFYLDV